MFFPFVIRTLPTIFSITRLLALMALAASIGVPLVRRFADSAGWVAPVAAVGVLVPLAVLTERQTHVYHDRFTLLENTLALNPTAWVAPQDLGNLLYDQGKYEQALEYDQKAIAVLEKLTRDYPSVNEYRNTLAGSYVSLGFHATKAEPQRRRGGVLRTRDFNPRSARARASRPERVPQGAGLVSRESGAGRSGTRQAGRSQGRIRLDDPAARAVAHENPSSGDYRNEVAANYVDLGLVERDLGETAAAEQSFKKAIELRTVRWRVSRREQVSRRSGLVLCSTWAYCATFRAPARGDGGTLASDQAA